MSYRGFMVLMNGMLGRRLSSESNSASSMRLWEVTSGQDVYPSYRGVGASLRRAASRLATITVPVWRIAAPVFEVGRLATSPREKTVGQVGLCRVYWSTLTYLNGWPDRGAACA
jgi:hypothetical protein